MPGLLRAGELDRSRIDRLIAAAREYASDGPSHDLWGKIVALLFFEDSLRTRLGFEVAAARLGATATTITQWKQTAQMAVSESLDDAVRCIAPYCDAICLRHSEPGVVDRVAQLVPTPVINCGNGDDEHPTQALIDLLAIGTLRGAIDGVRVAIVGDLRHMRVAHSLLLAIANYSDVHVRCIAPPGLEMPEPCTRAYLARGHAFEASSELWLDDIDVVYVAGLPSTPANGVVRADQDRYRLDPEVVGRLPERTRILCPLPRIDEIASAVDETVQAAYFEQNALGLPMRMAVLADALVAGPVTTGR